MEYLGFRIVSVDKYVQRLPSEHTGRREDIPSSELFLVFYGGVLMGVFFSDDEAKGFINAIAARNLSLTEMHVEYQQFLDQLEDVRKRFVLKKCHEAVLDMESMCEELENNSTISPR